ncbi:MAG TPA: hypothetical protein VEI73_05970 [Candidatus Acidoferrum sp.]|nr:hypothetical protein [Candidatus Acidoferrum sp.]
MASARLAITLIAGMSLGLVVHRQSEKTSTQVEIDAGLIDGTVFYENGTPVKGATVKAVPLGRPLAAIIPHADTDETGHFGIRISRSWFGECAVAAQKEDEDYPDMSQQFYSDGKFQTVTLTSSHPSASVTLRLGPKAGVLVGTVNDALTGAPLSPCVEIRRISEPNNFLSGSGLVKPSYKLLIPPETGIYMRIWLDGYKSWYFPGTTKESASQAVKLKPGERMTVNILLQPDAERAGTGCPKPIEVLHSR